MPFRFYKPHDCLVGRTVDHTWIVILLVDILRPTKFSTTPEYDVVHKI